MRHLGSLIAGIVLAPLCWLLIAFGQVGSASAVAKAAASGTYHTHDFVKPMIFLGIAGILIGLIACLRFSPLGPLVAGLAYVGSYAALLISPKATVDTLSYNVKIFHQTATLTLPLSSGLAPVLGAALLVAVFSASRWRRRLWPAGPLAETEPAGNSFAGFGGAGPDSGGSSWNSSDATPWASSGTLSSGTLSAGSLSADSPSADPLPQRTLSETPSSESTLADDTLTPRTSSFGLTKADEPGPTRSAPSDLGPRKAVWPKTREDEETTEAVPAKGRSPWDTPLRGTSSDQ